MIGMIGMKTFTLKISIGWKICVLPYPHAVLLFHIFQTVTTDVFPKIIRVYGKEFIALSN